MSWVPGVFLPSVSVVLSLALDPLYSIATPLSGSTVAIRTGDSYKTGVVPAGAEPGVELGATPVAAVGGLHRTTLLRGTQLSPLSTSSPSVTRCPPENVELARCLISLPLGPGDHKPGPATGSLAFAPGDFTTVG